MPIVKNICPAWVKIPMPIIQTKSFIFGVTQLKNTIGDNVITDINGKYLIIIKISSVNDNLFTVIYASDVDMAPKNAINTVNILSSMFKLANWYGFKIIRAS